MGAAGPEWPTVVAGVGGQPAYVFQSCRIDIGRCTEVRDRRNRLVRTNHLVFADTDDALNQTVSRRHAHLEYQAAEGAFRVYDDGSEQGTSVARGGRAIAVPPGPRGVRLQPGDENRVLGLARVKVKLPAAPGAGLKTRGRWQVPFTEAGLARRNPGGRRGAPCAGAGARCRRDPRRAERPQHQPSIFEPVCSGLMDRLAGVLRDAGMPFGFGGIARLWRRDLPITPERLLAEQVRMAPAAAASEGRSGSGSSAKGRVVNWPPSSPPSEPPSQPGSARPRRRCARTAIGCAVRSKPWHPCLSSPVLETSAAVRRGEGSLGPSGPSRITGIRSTSAPSNVAYPHRSATDDWCIVLGAIRMPAEYTEGGLRSAWV